jgi:hypothetical protein
MSEWCVQPIRSEYFWRSTNRERVILPSSEPKLRKNALFIDQSAFSNFALYVIKNEIAFLLSTCMLLEFVHVGMKDGYKRL